MKLSGRFRMIFGVFTGLALISMAVVAIQGSTQSNSVVATAHQDGATCSGDCATCPHAQSQPCPPEATDDAQSEKAFVDAERCIGCVRCVNVSPEAFRMNPETRKAEVIDGAAAEDVSRGALACPVDAIVQK